MSIKNNQQVSTLRILYMAMYVCMVHLCLFKIKSVNNPMADTLPRLSLNLPKCELHLHLDGSLSAAFIVRRAAARHVALPPTVGPDGSGLREHLHAMKSLQIQQGHKAAPGQNWDVFTFCNQFLQTREELMEATTDILFRFHAENVKLCEIRFCPSLHCLEGLSERDAVLAVVAGFRIMRERCGILGGVILCGLRSHTPEQTLYVAKICVELCKETQGLVLGFDIAGDEGSYPIYDHMASLELAHSAGCCVTVHAGEWPINSSDRSSLDNLKMVLMSGLIDRVGHGIQITSDEDFLHLFAGCTRSLICFECCLTANVGWKIPSYSVHPIKKMIMAGLNVTLNCDNTLLSGAVDREASPSGEIVKFISDVGMSYKDLYGVIMNSARSSFVYKAQCWSTEKRDEWIAAFGTELRNELHGLI